MGDGSLTDFDMCLSFLFIFLASFPSRFNDTSAGDSEGFSGKDPWSGWEQKEAVLRCLAEPSLTRQPDRCALMSQATATMPRAAVLVPVSVISSASRAQGVVTERDMSACNSLLPLILGPFPALSLCFLCPGLAPSLLLAKLWLLSGPHCCSFLEAEQPFPAS